MKGMPSVRRIVIHRLMVDNDLSLPEAEVIADTVKKALAEAAQQLMEFGFEGKSE